MISQLTEIYEAKVVIKYNHDKNVNFHQKIKFTHDRQSLPTPSKTYWRILCHISSC